MLNELIEGSRMKNKPYNQLAMRTMEFKEFLVQHLSYERCKSVNPRTQYIRYRQIIQHNQIVKVQLSSKHTYILSLLKKIWMELLFNNCINRFQEDYFSEKINLYKLKPRVANQYLFELYQLREFIEAGLKDFKGYRISKDFPLSNILLLSDQALYEVIVEKESHFKEGVQYNKDFERIKNVKKQSYDVLSSFQPKCVNYKEFMNKDLIYEDLRFILDKVVVEEENYKKDMKKIFGQGILCDMKVKKVDNRFNVIGIRRILAKWVENLIQSDPEFINSMAFHDFISKKKQVFNNFYINASDMIPPVHERINSLLLDLLIQSVYEGDKKNQQFKLAIYDFLRSKITVNSLEEIEQLIKRLEKAENTNRKIRIFRIKNRLNTHNRDVMINFVYGDFVPSQIQIGLGHVGSQQQKKAKKMKYEYKHFLYQLSRSIFGPTMELIITYQDNYHINSSANLYSVGVLKRRQKVLLSDIESSQIMCHNKHKMLLIKSIEVFKVKHEFCRSCFKDIPIKETFLYCYQCTTAYCAQCYRDARESMIAEMPNYRSGNYWEITATKQIQSLSAPYTLIFFHLDYSPASILMKSYLTFFNNQRLNKNKIQTYLADITNNQELHKYANKISIKRFPAFVLYKKNTIEKKLIGACIYQLFDLLNILEKNAPTKKCPNKHEIQFIQPSNFMLWKCNQCFRDRDNSEQKIFYCDKCLYVNCNRCAFSKNQAQIYKDQFGMSYLSTPQVIQSDFKCSNKHKMRLTHVNKSSQLEYKCFKCNKDFFFVAEFGMYVCDQCPDILCDNCAQISCNIINHEEYANHLIEFYNLEMPLCGNCDYPYKKTYRNTKGKKFWKCTICKSQFDQQVTTNEGQVACFRCNIDLCLPCSQTIKKPDIVDYNLQCSCKGHINQVTEIKQMTSDTFLCTDCHRRYYFNTKHFQCDKCRFPYCFECIKNYKISIKLFCYKVGDRHTSVLREFLLEDIRINQKLTEIQEMLKLQKLIASNCGGVFKRTSNETQGLDMNLTIAELGKNAELHYFQSYQIIDDLIYHLFEEGHSSDQENQEHQMVTLSKSLQKIQSAVSKQVGSTSPNLFSFIIDPIKEVPDQPESQNQPSGVLKPEIKITELPLNPPKESQKNCNPM